MKRALITLIAIVLSFVAGAAAPKVGRALAPVAAPFEAAGR